MVPVFNYRPSGLWNWTNFSGIYIIKTKSPIQPKSMSSSSQCPTSAQSIVYPQVPSALTVASQERMTTPTNTWIQRSSVLTSVYKTVVVI